MKSLPRIHVAPNNHALTTEHNQPFLWLGDTDWDLFHRLGREEAKVYLADRAAKGFTVIQAVALAELDGLHTPNVYADCPLNNDDPEQPNEPYWQYVDEVIDMAANLGLYIGLLPTWGDKMTPMWDAGPIVFTEANTAAYGEWIGQRYANRSNVLWILGGDRPPVAEIGSWGVTTDPFDHRPLWRAMATGIEQHIPDALISYHPPGGTGSSIHLHDEAWLDVNMYQSGHGSGRDVPIWQMITHDYQLTPTKPTLDSEPNYEDHPVSPWPTWDPANGYFRDHDVHKQCYRSILAGACGVTYGHHSIWQFYDPATREPVNHPDCSWQAALDRPGAQHMRHLRDLFERFPLTTLVPDQQLLASSEGVGGAHIRAARETNGHHALVYLPESAPVTINLERLAGGARASWFDPRSGETQQIDGEASGAHTFTPPAYGPDWVLVLEADAKA